MAISVVVQLLLPGQRVRDGLHGGHGHGVGDGAHYRGREDVATETEINVEFLEFLEICRNAVNICYSDFLYS